MPTVFIIAHDWLLRAGVRAELRELGIEALGMESAADVGRALAEGRIPAVVVVEATADLATDPAMQNLARHAPMVVVASRTQPVSLETPGVVIYRPLRIGDVVTRVRQLLEATPV